MELERMAQEGWVAVERLNTALRPLRITYYQAWVLGLFAERPLYMMELRDLLGHTQAAVSVQADRLVRKGWLDRYDAPEDRRRVMLEITPQGTEALIKVRVAIESLRGNVPESVL